jgi:hypothetical protein
MEQFAFALAAVIALPYLIGGAIVLALIIWSLYLIGVAVLDHLSNRHINRTMSRLNRRYKRNG